MKDLLPLDEALTLIGEAASSITDTETCLMKDALGRTLAEDVTAPCALPPYTSTAVDGYAFRHDGQRSFTLIGASYAGAVYDGTVETGYAVRIATGAVLPDGADTVVMQENCNIAGEIVTASPLPAPGANIRPAGADIAAGAVAAPKGRRLRPQDIALLGSLGLTRIDVLRPIRIGIASTGQELREAGTALGRGEIFNTNSLMLSQMLDETGCKTTILPTFPDDAAATEKAFLDASERFDLIVTAGGVSVGDKDFVKATIAKIGRVHFWRLKIRPGKPVVFGTIGRCHVMGLPGNPVSAFVTCLLLVKPLIGAMLGRAPALPPAFEVPLAEGLKKDAPLRCFYRARLEEVGGVLSVRAYGDQGSNLFRSMTEGDGLIDLPVEAGDLAAGSAVRFRPYALF